MYENTHSATYTQESIKVKKGRPSREEELFNRIKKSQNKLKLEKEKLRKKLKEEEDKLKAKIKREEDLINTQMKIAKEATDKKVASIVRKYWNTDNSLEDLELQLEDILGERV
ncbi:MAG: hypothetical protein K8R44_04620 [Sulfurimonas sp.]|nr:hypothetical protein [Sulfurimonas sp.]